MKAEDLRIGNIYNRIHGKGYTETVIDEALMGKIFSSDSQFALNDFQPIPLTPEWLERAGFNYADDMYGIPDFPFAIIIVNNFPCLYCEYYGGDVYEKQIQFVHQLQNLYHALTGNELTFNP